MPCGRWFPIFMLLAGCSGWRIPEKAQETKPAPSKYRFDYALSNAAPVSLLRVFDDGGNTYFQFRTSPPEALVVSAQTRTGEAIIPHERMGNYAVIRGVYRQSRIPSANLPVVARKLGEIAPMADVGPVILPKPVAQTPAPLQSQAVPVVSQRTRTVTQTIRFARNSSRLGPLGRADLATVLSNASGVSKIEVRVRPFYPNRRASIRLAEARAAAIRAALVEATIDDSKLYVDTQSATQPLVAEVILHSTEQRGADQPSTATTVSAGPFLQAAEHRPTRPAMVATHLMQGASE